MNLKEVLQNKSMPGVGSTQDLEAALDKALSESVAKLDPKVTAESTNLSDQIELVVASQFNDSLDQKKQKDVKFEQYQKFMQLQNELDGCEQIVG